MSSVGDSLPCARLISVSFNQSDCQYVEVVSKWSIFHQELLATHHDALTFVSAVFQTAADEALNVLCGGLCVVFLGGRILSERASADALDAAV
jgi:hypothetical protein